MSAHSAAKIVCKVYLKKIHQVLVAQQENSEKFRVISRKSCFESLSDRPDRLCRSLVEVFPGFKCETGVDEESIREERSCLRTWLGDVDDLASRRV